MNITLKQTGSSLTVVAENRRYRSQAQALADLLKQSTSFAAENDSIHVILTYAKAKLVYVSTSGTDLLAQRTGKLPYDAWLAQLRISSVSTRTESYPERYQYTSTPQQSLQGSLKHTTTPASVWFKEQVGIKQPVHNTTGTEQTDLKQTDLKQTGLVHVTGPSSMLRSWDLVTGIGLRYQLGNYGDRSDNYRLALDIEPELRFDLPGGLLARARFALPLYNNLDRNTRVRPVILALHRPMATAQGLRGVVSVGAFTRNRYGAQVQLHQEVYPEWISVQLSAAYTGFTPIMGQAAFPREDQRTYVTYQAGGTLRWPAYQLEVSMRYGVFLYQDQGYRLDLVRSFGDGMVGFFLADTDLGQNGGLQFSIPLSPRRYLRPIPVRIRPASGFNLAYRYRGNELEAREFDTGFAFEELLRGYQPSLIKKELARYLR